MTVFGLTVEQTIALLVAVGAGALIREVLLRVFKHRDDRRAVTQEVSKAQIEAKTGEAERAWGQVQMLLQRVDALSQQRGEIYQAMADAKALERAKDTQVTDLIARLSTALVQKEEIERRMEDQRVRYEERIERLAKRLDEKDAEIEHLEGELARCLRGGMTRHRDTPTGHQRRVIDSGEGPHGDLQSRGLSDRGGPAGDPGAYAADPDRARAADRPDSAGPGPPVDRGASGHDRDRGPGG